jgi:hypothetical protein
VGTFARRALPLVIANRCGVPIPITRDAAVRASLFTLTPILGYLHCAFPQEPLIVARLVVCLPLRNSMLSVTPGGRSALVHSAPSASPAPPMIGSALSQNSSLLGAMCQIQSITLHLVTLVYLPVRLAPFGHYTSERLTKPYSGELPACAVLSQLANIARLPIGPAMRPSPRLEDEQHCGAIPGSYSWMTP